MSSPPDEFPIRDAVLERPLPSAPDVEKAILGAILMDNNLIAEAIEGLVPSDFYVPSHRRIFIAMIGLFETSFPIIEIDTIVIAEELRRDNSLDASGGVLFLTNLSYGLPHVTSLSQYIKIVKKKSILRQGLKIANKFTAEALEDEGDPEVVVENVTKAFFDLSITQTKKGFTHLATIIHRNIQRAYEIQNSGKTVVGLSTGFSDLDAKTLGLQRKDYVVIAARPSMGKAQPLDSKILLANGDWIPMAQVRLGEFLASPDGGFSMVTGIFPQGERDIYRITFSDGRSTEIDYEHLWSFHKSFPKPANAWKESHLLSTAQVLDLVKKNDKYRNALWVDPANPDFTKVPLPLDPWLLGILIGDGNLSGGGTPGLASKDDEILCRVRKAVALLGMQLKHVDRCNYRLVKAKRSSNTNPVTKVLRDLHLWNTKTKFIPDRYLKADYSSRLELLRGLLDSDGWAEKSGSVGFSSTSYTLCKDVIYLARSLGCLAKIAKTRVSSGYKMKSGAHKECKPSWCVYIGDQKAERLFWLKRKSARAKRKSSRRPRLTIKSIEYSRRDQAQCIQVSHPDGLYITDDFVVTHNTALAVDLSLHAALQSNAHVAFFSLEMGEDPIGDRFLCAHSRVDSQKFRGGYLSSDDWARIENSENALSTAKIFIEDSPDTTVVKMKAKASKLIVEHGPLDLLVLDGIWLMAGSAGSKRSENRQQEVTTISRELKLLAKDMNVPLVALHQLNRGPENRTDHRPILSDLRESGSIEQDADMVWFLYREDMYRPKTEAGEKSNICEVIIAKHRNGPTGTVALRFDEPTGRFDPLYHDQHHS